jgi:hypothetical protein
MNDPQFDIVPAAAAPIPRAIEAYEATVSVTFAALHGDLADPVAFDSTDANIKMMLAEALRTGGVRGIPMQANADLTNYVVDRFPANAEYPNNRIMLRPKTAFGA